MSYDDPTDLVAQRQRAEEAQERAKQIERLMVSDLKWLMNDKRGRRFMARLLERTGMGNSSFDTNNASMSFKEGVRWLGIKLTDEIQTHCFDRWIEMLKEQRIE